MEARSDFIGGAAPSAVGHNSVNVQFSAQEGMRWMIYVAEDQMSYVAVTSMAARWSLFRAQEGWDVRWDINRLG